MADRTLNIENVGKLMYARGRSNPTEGTVDVVGLTLERDGKIYDFLSYLPQGWKVELGHDESGTSTHYKRVKLKEEGGLVALIDALHELGHSRDYSQLSKEGYDVTLTTSKVIRPDGTTFKDTIDYMEMEYKAWEFALGIIRDLKLDQTLSQEIYKLVRASLQTYMHGIIHGQQYNEIRFPAALELAAKNSNREFDELKQQLLRSHNIWLENNLNQ